MCLHKAPRLPAEQRCQGQEGSKEGGCAHMEQTPDLVTGPGPHKTLLRALVRLLPWQPGRLECEPPAGRGGGLRRQLGPGHGLATLLAWHQEESGLSGVGSCTYSACGPWELRKSLVSLAPCLPFAARYSLCTRTVP